MNSKCVYKLIFCLLLIIVIIAGYSFCVNRVCNRLDSYYENKNDFLNEEKVLKTNVALQNNILGKKSKYYHNALENIIYFYEKQWMFDKAEYWQKEYLKNTNEITQKQLCYKDLAYYLQRQKKYNEAIDYLLKGKEFVASYIDVHKENSQKIFVLDWDFYLSYLYFEKGDVNLADNYRKNKDNKTGYYYIKKSMTLKQYENAKEAIVQEYIYNPNGLETDMRGYSGSYKYINFIKQEQYRNILRNFLLEIYISEKNQEKINQLLNVVKESENKIYGYYSPENLCNEYKSYILLNDKKPIGNLKEISSKLVYFEGKNQQDFLVNISDFCKMN